MIIHCEANFAMDYYIYQYYLIRREKQNMILLIDILINIIITCIFIILVNSYSKMNNEKAMHVMRLAFTFKFFIYIPSAFIMSYFLSRYPYQNFFSLVPILFIIFLMLFDSIAFYKVAIKIRNIKLTFIQYIVEIIKESILIVLPLCLLYILKNILAETDTFFILL